MLGDEGLQDGKHLPVIGVVDRSIRQIGARDQVALLVQGQQVHHTVAPLVVVVHHIVNGEHHGLAPHRHLHRLFHGQHAVFVLLINVIDVHQGVPVGVELVQEILELRHVNAVGVIAHFPAAVLQLGIGDQAVGKNMGHLAVIKLIFHLRRGFRGGLRSRFWGRRGDGLRSCCRSRRRRGCSAWRFLRLLPGACAPCQKQQSQQHRCQACSLSHRVFSPSFLLFARYALPILGQNRLTGLRNHGYPYLQLSHEQAIIGV